MSWLRRLVRVRRGWKRRIRDVGIVGGRACSNRVVRVRRGWRRRIRDVGVVGGRAGSNLWSVYSVAVSGGSVFTAAQ